MFLFSCSSLYDYSYEKSVPEQSSNPKNLPHEGFARKRDGNHNGGA